MTIKEIIEEVDYYIGRRISKQEAEEIKWHLENHPGTSLEEIVSAYYGC